MYIRNILKKKIETLMNPSKSGKVTIPNHRGDIPQRVVNSILKQAGLK
jgi:predicted RNA binding protein YcfA (HicA-like mRNA interferase family)